MLKLWRWLGVVFLALAGCQPEIGDDCKVSLDCSSLGNRLCDRTQPGGYCTLPDCEEGTCPDEAVCVRFRPEDLRLATTYCMAKCDGNSDCRGSDGYHCVTGAEFNETGEMGEMGEMDADGPVEAVVLDGEGRRFCAQRATPFVEEASAAPGDDPAESDSDGATGDDASDAGM